MCQSVGCTPGSVTHVTSPCYMSRLLIERSEWSTYGGSCIKIGFVKGGEFLDQLSNYQLLKQDARFVVFTAVKS
jgi:hypothetical protein